MDYLSTLKEIFPNKNEGVIENIIRIVEENVQEANEIKLDTMVDLLSVTGDPVVKHIVIEEPGDSGQLDEAAGIDWSAPKDLIEIELQKQRLSQLVDVLPDADPSYLDRKAKELYQNEEELQNFVSVAIETKNYPSKAEYLKREGETAERRRYTRNFHLYEFLKEYPEPFKHFEIRNQNHSLSKDNLSNKSEDEINREKEVAVNFLYDIFPYVRKSNIKKIFNLKQSNVVEAATYLRKQRKDYLRPRQERNFHEEDLTTNLLLLKEMAFVANYEEIRMAIDFKQKNLEKARELGLLQTCSICYFEELIPEECYICSNECIFCRDCICRGFKLVIAEEKLEMGCLSECGGEYSLTTLQMVLDKSTFTHYFKKKQLHEIESAKIDGIEFCCLCYKFACIPNPDDKIFHCMNCRKDSCRLCKHESHVPLRCNEIEYDEDVKMRTYIENKMTEALVRKCYNCGKQYVKSSGCNKIICNCGAIMCYLCKKSISDYKHFGAQCPLFTDDDVLHLSNVKEGALKAKAELGVDKNPTILKIDPAKDL